MPDRFRISVLISGGGTTLKNLVQCRDRGKLNVDIVQVLSNNPTAGGLEIAADAKIRTTVINHKDVSGIEPFSSEIFESIRKCKADLVVMGGFLRRVKIPCDFENRVINIHPSLIPSFCGKGHYGFRVHRGVIEYGCKISGCTVHFVDDQYDHGPIIAQTAVPVLNDDTPEDLARRVFEKECELYPQVINSIAAGHVTISNRRVKIM